MSEPFLPVDLEREIFETTAYMHPSTVPTLLRVAQRVLIWIEPLLFRVIRSSKCPAYIMKSKSPAFLQRAVRHLCLESGTRVGHLWSLAEQEDILERCKGLVDLGLTGEGMAVPGFLPILARSKQVNHMSVCLTPLFGGPIDMTHPALTSVSHLSILDIGSRHGVLSGLPALPNLTHIRFTLGFGWEAIKTLLVECPNLQVLLVAWPYSLRADCYRWAKRSPVEDVRFVVTVYEGHHADQWESAARGSAADLLIRADEFVGLRRDGKIKATRFWLDEYLHGRFSADNF